MQCVTGLHFTGDKVVSVCASFTFVSISFIPQANSYETNAAGCPEQTRLKLNSTFFYILNLLPPHLHCPSVSSNDPNAAGPSCPPVDAAH